MHDPCLSITHTPCVIRHLDHSVCTVDCSRCGHAAPRVWNTDRIAIDIALDHPILLQVTVSIHSCATCQQYMRAQPPFLRPAAIDTNRVVEQAVQSVYQDGMAINGAGRTGRRSIS